MLHCVSSGAVAMSSSGSGSESGSGSGGDLDPETAALLRDAPRHARIGEYLDRQVATLPGEVAEALRGLGASVASSRRLKVSFHATFLVDLASPLVHDGSSATQVIVQVLGVQLGDKAICGQLSAATMVKAAELGARAGVRVAKIFGTGSCSPGGGVGPLDFVIQEFINTQTVEDRVFAPGPQAERIHREIRSKLGAISLEDVDTEPLPRFQTLQVWLQWMVSQVPAWDADLLSALTLFTESILGAPPPSLPAVLLHQDMNCGNVLCSADAAGQWSLDALIDWESAAVADPRCMGSEEPFTTARAFALVTKGSFLAQQWVAGALPRCELAELIENYDRAASVLDDKGWLRRNTWAARVKMATEGAARW